jgi:carbon monoxide dehydrogenase subunit G
MSLLLTDLSDLSDGSPAKASDYTIDGNKNKALFYFGDEQYKAGNEFVAKTSIKITGEVAKAAKTRIHLNPNNNSTSVILKSAGVDLATGLMDMLFTEIAVDRKTIVTIDMELKRLFAGCADLKYEQNSYLIRSDTPDPSLTSSSSKTMTLFKLYPNYNITFVADGYQLFGHQHFRKDEILNSEEYKYVTATKDRKDFNRRAYKKLTEKVIALCRTTFPDGQDNGLLQTLQQRLEFATQGLSYQTIENRYGIFKGWMDMSNRLNGYGYSRLSSGHEYTGEWKNNKHSGIGKLTMPDIGVYSGGFANGKFHNGGVLEFDTGDRYEGNFYNGKYDGKGVYIFGRGDVFNGVWKNDKPQSGVFTYANGDVYDGQVRDYEKERHWKKEGKGKMTYANGDMYIGEWKNDLYNGTGIMTYANKEVANGKWKNGKFIIKK